MFIPNSCSLCDVSARSDRERQRPAAPDEDDWFATPAVEPTALPAEVAWQDEPEPLPEPVDGLGRRQAIVVLAAIAAVVLGGAGIVLARSLGGSDTPSATTATTAPVTNTAPAASTPTTTASTTPSQATTPTAGAVPTDAVLRAGSSGASVTALQETLTQIGYAPGTADGKYGASTAAAVAAFQTSNGLTADGVAGPKTIAAINTAAAGG